jgi:hypothetical protein
MRKMLFVTAALCAIPTIASADETLKFRVVYHLTDVQFQDAADTSGHVIGVVRSSGLASMPDGSVATYGFVGTIDYVKGAGTYVLYDQITFSDGSALFTKGSGVATPEATKTTFKGTIAVIGGKGKYEGAKGDGTTTGTRMQPMPGVGAELYGDITLDLKTGDQADAAKAMLTKAVAAIKADRDVALIAFQKGEGGFRQGDLYPFCARISDGKGLAGPVATLAGTDARTLKDINGKPFGQEQYDAAVKNPEGAVTLVEYMFPKPGTTTPAVPKASWITRIGDLYCGVGYYK